MEDFTHFIFAADSGINRDSFAKQLGRFPHKCLRGGYVMEDGSLVEEDSYLVPFAAWTALKEFFAGQESILWLTDVYHKPALRRAYLEYLGGDMVDLGWFQQVPKEVTHDRDDVVIELAHEYGGYTVEVETGKLFIAAPKRF